MTVLKSKVNQGEIMVNPYEETDEILREFNTISVDFKNVIDRKSERLQDYYNFKLRKVRSILIKTMDYVQSANLNLSPKSKDDLSSKFEQTKIDINSLIFEPIEKEIKSHYNFYPIDKNDQFLGSKELKGIHNLRQKLNLLKIS